MIKLIIKTAEKGLNIQKKNGSMPSGHNGPWNDNDTPVRVTAHWSILFSKVYKITKNKKFKYASIKAISYIKTNRSEGFSFKCRNNKSKCNGLIGQAWIIEALLETKNNEDLQIAKELILQHKFNSNLGLWHSLEIDGSILDLNMTLNQQIWFCAMAKRVGNITKDKIIVSRVELFIKKLHDNIDFNGSFITHKISAKYKSKILNNIFKKISNTIIPQIFGKTNAKKLSVGYLSFVLYGLAILKEEGIELDFKVIEYIENSLQFLEKNIFKFPIIKESYLWAYNPTGFEVAYVLKMFKMETNITGKEWTLEQLRRHFDFEKQVMNKNTSDPDILTARIYEAIKLDDIKLDI